MKCEHYCVNRMNIITMTQCTAVQIQETQNRKTQDSTIFHRWKIRNQFTGTENAGPQSAQDLETGQL